MALVVTTRNLAVSQNRATKDSSKARLWVYDRRLELLTRAFTLWGTCACRIASHVPGPIFGCGTSRPGGCSRRNRHRGDMNHVDISGLTSRDVQRLHLGWGSSLRSP